MNKRAKSILLFTLISLVLASLVYFAYVIFVSAASVTANVTPTNVNEDVYYLYNFTVNNTNVTANITQVNITLPDAFTFDPTNTTNGTSAITPNVVISGNTISWTNVTNQLIINGTAANFWINVSAPNPGTYNFTITSVDDNQIVTTNFTAITVNDTTAPSVSLVTPQNATISSSPTFTFNCSAIDNANLANITLYIWNSTNSIVNQTTTAVSGLINEAALDVVLPYEDAFKWNCRAGDTSSKYAWNSSNRTVTFDASNPQIISAGVSNPDVFFSPYDSIVNISVNISDLTALTVAANFSNISTSACGTNGILNLTYSGGLWKGNCSIASYITSTEPQPRIITIVAADSATPPHVNATVPQLSATPPIGIIVHDLGAPAMNGTQWPEICMRFGSDTVNFSRVLDFGNINFVMDMEANFSCLSQGQGPPGLPSNYQDVNLINITSINMSTQNQSQRLMQLPQAIQLSITRPKQFGDSRIYINSSFFTELNTTATIKFYNLPFASKPNIINDAGAAGVNSTTINWTSNGYVAAMGVATGNLTFIAYGFTGYNLSDNSTPIITINAPSTNIKNGENTNVVVNVTINGTGTEPSYIQISLNSSLVKIYNGSSGGANTAQCTNISSDKETFNCIFLANLSDGAYNLNATAWDFGGEYPGKLNSSSLAFNVDTTTLSIFLMSYPANGSYLNINSTTFIFNISDAGNTNVDCNIVIDENYTNGLTVNAINMSTVVNTSAVNQIPNGLHNWTIECYDNGGDNGNPNDTGIRYFTVDTVKPVPVISSPAAYSNQSSKTILINTTVTETNWNYTTITVYNGSMFSVNSTTNTTSQSVNTSLSVAADGAYSVFLSAYDLAGNSNTTSRNITVDSATPIITVYSPVNNATYYANQSVIIQFSMTDLTPSRLWYMNDTGNSSTQSGSLFTSAINFTTNGAHTFRFYGNDSFNILGTAVITFNIASAISENSTLITNQTTVNINETMTQLIVAYNSSLQNVTINSTFSNQSVSLNLSQIISSGNVTIPNQFTLTRQSTSGINYTAVIPANTNISGGSDWDGKIVLPIINTSSFSSPVSGTVNIAIDVGSTVELNFSQPVKIIIGGMAGKKAGWARGLTALTEISTQCDNETNPTNINATSPRECYIDSGSDLVIWTHHFTTFAAYTIAAITTTGGLTNTGGGIYPKPAAQKEVPKEVEVSRRPTLVPGIGLQNNTKLQAAIEKVLAKGKLSETAMENLQRLSASITSSIETSRGLKIGANKSTLTLSLKIKGDNKIKNFIVREIIPKEFAGNSNLITVTASGAKVEVVEQDPEYIITYPEVSPGQDLSISYDVNAVVGQSVIDAVSTEIYAESTEKVTVPTTPPTTTPTAEAEKAAMSWLQLVIGALIIIAVVVIILAVRKKKAKHAAHH